MLLPRHQGGKHLHRPLGPGENQKPKRGKVIKVKKETEDSAQER